MDDAEYLDLLTELSDDSTSGEQMAALVHVLGHEKPWDILNVQQTASEKEAASYESTSLLLHPDKCSHPRVAEAFQKLSEAYNWAKDKKDWEARQLASE
jgi:DnaJ-class molecular chaperone